MQADISKAVTSHKFAKGQFDSETGARLLRANLTNASHATNLPTNPPSTSQAHTLAQVGN